MTKPVPDPIEPDQLVGLAQLTMREAKFPCLASLDGDQPRLRPVSPVKVDGFTVFVANLKQYHKTQELAANPKVELCYLDGDHNQVRITGIAEVLKNETVLQEIWDSSPLLRQYLGSRDNPALIVYQINPSRVRYMREWALEYYEVEI
jgi:general stress protein 26